MLRYPSTLKKTGCGLVLTCFLLAVSANSVCRAADQEAELFVVAQKAFDDGFYDVAIRYINEFLEKYPQSAKQVQANLLLGQCHFFKGEYLKAFGIFQGLLKFTDFKDATLFWLGETYLKGSDFKQAEDNDKQLIDLFPNSFYVPQAYYSLSWAQFEEKKFAEAKETLTAFTTKFPRHDLMDDVSFKLGECEYDLRNYQNTVKAFQNYVIQFPKSARHDQAYFYMGESYYYLEDFSSALTYYGKSSEISKSDKLILLSKIGSGWSHLKLKEYDKSREAFDAALKISLEKSIPSDDVYLGQATLFSEVSEYQKALEAYDQLIQHFPDSPRIAESYLGRANALYLLGNYDEAIKQHEATLARFAQNPDFKEIIEKTYFGLGWVYLKTGKADLAITNFQTVVDQTTNKVMKISALSQIGDAYQDTGDLTKATEIYDKILKDFPDNPYTDYIQYREGVALLKSDKIEAATLAFQSLQKNFPESKYLSQAKYYLGLAYFKKEDWAAAEDQLAKFIEGFPVTDALQPQANYLLGLSHFNTGDYEEAMKIFNKVLKNYPDDLPLTRDTEVAIAKSIYQLNDDKEALKRFKIIAYKYPQTDTALESLLWLGDYYLKFRDYDNAILYYNQILEQFPGSEKINRVRYSLGEAYREKGSFDQALNYYKLIDESADKELAAKAKLAIADIFSKEMDPASAIEAYKKVTETVPEFVRDAYLKIAEIYKNNRDYPSALETLEKGLVTDRGLSKITNAEVQFNIADMYEMLNRSNEAVEAYLRIPYLYPKDAYWAVKAYLRVGRIFEDAKDWENARLVYTKIVDYGTEEAKFAKEKLEWIKNNNAQGAQ